MLDCRLRAVTSFLFGRGEGVGMDYISPSIWKQRYEGGTLSLRVTLCDVVPDHRLVPNLDGAETPVGSRVMRGKVLRYYLI